MTSRPASLTHPGTGMWAWAAIATGRHVHWCCTWSSAEPCDGSMAGWGERRRFARRNSR